MAFPVEQHGEPPDDLHVVRPVRTASLGPFVALLVPGVLVVLAVGMLTLWPCSGRGCIEPSLGAWVVVLFAFPTALAAGLPWFVNALSVAATVVTSLALWMVLGGIAGRRTARKSDAGWFEFAKEILVLSGGVIGGVILGFAVIAVWIRV